MTDAGRAERIARNEARFRELNSELEQGLETLSLDPEERAAFVCECGRAECSEMVKLLLGDYKAAHVDDCHFVVLPGHELLGAERVIGRHESHFVVEKLNVGEVPDIVDRGGDKTD